MKWLTPLFLVVLSASCLWANAELRETAGGLNATIAFDSATLARLSQGERRAGFVPVGTAGYPAIYAQALHVAIPAAASVTLSILSDSVSLAKSQIPDFPADFEGPRPAIALPDVYPPEPVRVSEVKQFRQVQYVDVLVFPVQVERSKGLLRVHSKLTFRLGFSKAPGAKINDAAAFTRLYDRFFVNTWRDKGPAVPSVPHTVAPWQPPAHTGAVYKIRVRWDGVYKLDYSFLSANTSWNLSGIDPRNLRLFNKGSEIAIHVSGESDGTFDPADAVYFYGQALKGENDAGVWEKGDFTDDNVYWLLVGDQNGLRMSERDVSPIHGYPVAPSFASTIHYEENPGTYTDFDSFFQTQADTDLWLWKQAKWVNNDNSQAVQHYNLPVLAAADDSSFQDTLLFECRGRSYRDVDPDHHVVVKVEGNTLGDFYLDDYETAQQSFSFSQSLLGATGNFSVELSHEVTDPALLGIDIDSVSSNWWELTYSRKFEAYNSMLEFSYGQGNHRFQVTRFASMSPVTLDISSPGEPAWLVNFQMTPVSGYYTMSLEDALSGETKYSTSVPFVPSTADFLQDVPSNLAGISNLTNWILIAGDPFASMPEAQALKSLRESQGLHAEVVNVTDIYDEFNYGIFSPYAMKDFLQYVYALSDPPQLEYVLLLGDADYDYKDYGLDGNWNLVPTYMVADPGLQSAYHPWPIHSFDNYFGCFSGTDSVPEIFIGRIPVRTTTEASDALSKILLYDTGITDHSWVGNMVFAADCQDADSFEPFQDQNAGYVRPAPPFHAAKMYFRNPPWNCSNKDGDGNGIADVADRINEGQSVVSWIGHGSHLQWGAPSYLHYDDIPLLTNIFKPTVMLNADCYTGMFYDPAEPDLAEGMMEAQTGMVSGFAPGSYMFTFQGGYATESFYADIFGKDKERVLGALYEHLFADLDAAGDSRTTQQMTAFGDPATRLAIPAPEQPLNLHVSAGTCNSATLAWDAVAGAAGYNLFRAASPSGPYALLNSIVITDTLYLDAGLTSGMAYYYAVAAVDAEGFEGRWSDPLQYTVPAGNPLTISPPTLPDGLVGQAYNQTLTATGGTGPYTYEIVSGSLPAGLALSSDGIISGNPSVAGSFAFTISVTDSADCGTGSYTIAISSPCLFCDEFDDNVLSPDWLYKKGAWSESGGALIGTYVKKATALATPAFAGCGACYVETIMQTAGGEGNQLRLVGWYADKKNRVEAVMKEGAGAWILKQHSAGFVVARAKAFRPIQAGVPYKVRIAFDGTVFSLYVDDTLVLTMPKGAVSAPFGTVGFVVKSTAGTFDYVHVN